MENSRYLYCKINPLDKQKDIEALKILSLISKRKKDSINIFCLYKYFGKPYNRTVSQLCTLKFSGFRIKKDNVLADFSLFVFTLEIIQFNFLSTYYFTSNKGSFVFFSMSQLIHYCS